ncbi:DUF397 domain-containing protein [Streptomyces sp. SID5910]|uniref:DUF397 domain-containing protein n=1 Tax=Streptomyces sp. SID5910 TaxID=2690312 RepID=UPI00136EBC5D|nr:DUF397 domain-containing protein [Streptomyces sp. SID5910]MYR46582.1 DUF397 domain-containing protein [Streptomyces sp. SID5910]
MNHIADASTLPVTWWKSSASGAQSDCVEFGIVNVATVAVRDSKAPTGPALLLDRASLAGLVDGIKSGAL